MDLKSLCEKWDDTQFLVNAANVTRIPCGIAPFDVAMGGGMPRGRTLELYGPESCGKSTIALHFIRSVQRHGGSGLVLDGEFACDDSRATALKLDLEKLVIAHPESMEDMYDLVDRVADQAALDVENSLIGYAIDSIASFVPRDELAGKYAMAAQARMNSTRLRATVSKVARSQGILIGVNQERDNIGVMYGDKGTTPGGRAWKFYCSIRVRLRAVKLLKGADVRPYGITRWYADDAVGAITQFKVVKNKTASPMKQVHGVIFYETGYHSQLSMFETFRALKMVKSKGKNWRVIGTDFTFDKGTLIESFKENGKMLKTLLRTRLFPEEEVSDGNTTDETYAEDDDRSEDGEESASE